MSRVKKVSLSASVFGVALILVFTCACLSGEGSQIGVDVTIPPERSPEVCSECGAPIPPKDADEQPSEERKQHHPSR